MASIWIKDIKSGEIFFERTRKFEAIEDARTEVTEIQGTPTNQYFVFGKCLNSQAAWAKTPVQFMETEGIEGYGPKLRAGAD